MAKTVRSGDELRAATAQKAAQLQQPKNNNATNTAQPKQTVRSGDELRQISAARGAQLQRAEERKSSGATTYNPGNTYDTGSMGYYLTHTEKQYDKANTQQIKSDFYTRANNHFNDNSRTLDSSKGFYDEAIQNSKNAVSKEDKDFWDAMAGNVKNQMVSDANFESAKLRDARSKLESDKATNQQNLKNYQQSVYMGMQTADVLSQYNQALKDNANYDKQIKAMQEQEAQLNAMLFDTLASDDVKAARQRLSDDKYAADWGYLAPGEAVTQRDLDQQTVDQFMQSIGQQTQYYNFADTANAVLTKFGESLQGSAGNLAALGLSEADFYNSLPEDLRMLVSDPEAMSKATPEQLAQMQAYREQFNANSGNGGRLGAMTDKAEAWADEHDAQAAEEIRKAKQGLSKFGQFGVDLASTALDVGFDAVTGLGLGSMAARVMGSSVGEARRAGANTEQQIMYGLTNTAIELLTEKMTDGLGLVYGKGVPTDIAEKVINKLARTDAGANLLRLLNAGLGEGMEEVVSDLLNPFAQWIIDENARDNRTYDIDPSELLYDFLLGSAMGLAGGVGEAVSGGNAEANAQYKAEEQARFDKMYEEGAEFTQKDVRDLNRLESRIDSEPQNRSRLKNEAKATEAAVAGETHSRLNKEDDKVEKKDALGNPLNRMRKLTDRMARIAERLGYGNKSNQDEAYKTATGMTPEEMEAKNNAESQAAMQEAGKQPKGGDASPYNLDNYDQTGINRLWKDRKMTSGQYAEAMVQKGYWSEATARSFLSLVRREGNRLGLNTTEERRRNLGNYSIGQQNTQPAAQEAATPEASTAPAAEAKAAEPVAEEKPANKSIPSAQTLTSKEQFVSDILGNKNANWSKYGTPQNDAEQLYDHIIKLKDKNLSPELRKAVNDVIDNLISYMVKYGQNRSSYFEQELAKGLLQKVQSKSLSLEEAMEFAKGQYLGHFVFDTYADLANDNYWLYMNPGQSMRGEPEQAYDGKNLYTKHGDTWVKGEAREPSHAFWGVTYRAHQADAMFIDNPLKAQQKNDTVEENKSTREDVASATIDTDKTQQGNKTISPQNGKWTQDEIDYIKSRGGTVSDLIDLGKRESEKGNFIFLEVPVDENNVEWHFYDGKTVYTLNEETYKLTPKASGADALKWLDSKEAANAVEHENPRVYSSFETQLLIKLALDEHKKREAQKGANVNGQEKTKNDVDNRTSGVQGNSAASGERPGVQGQDSSGSESSGAAIGKGPESSRITQKAYERRAESCKRNGVNADDILPDSDNPATVSVFEDISKGPIFIATTEKTHAAGFADVSKDSDAYGIVLVLNKYTATKLGNAAAHETGHRGITAHEAKTGKMFSADNMINKALDAITSDEASRDLARKKIFGEFSKGWHDYLENMLPEAEIKKLDSGIIPLEGLHDYIITTLNLYHPNGVQAVVYEYKMGHEIANELLARSYDWFDGTGIDFSSLEKMSEVIGEEFANEQIFTPEEVARITQSISALNIEGARLYDKLRYGQQLTVSKESQSAAQEGMTARGEREQTKKSGTAIDEELATGDGTYLSRTNAERSEEANRIIKEGMEAETQRLINKKERWDDQEVVTAERIMYEKIRAIRDYQLGNKHKMPPSGMAQLKKEYNALALRHTAEKSKAGQELQATYQFTPEEQIMTRMAKTFLGFAKDGTFAGEAPLAVNAKIYAAAEDAANRITEAVEAKDAKALAQICKDISDIRGVKNMFGVASGFASKVENEILNAIAKQENGVEALQTLALGNLNAIADDVQPYKVVNAAKTIRIMNMLSNMSTIVNNITNNIASGMTSTNALAQGSSMLASKAFENIIGQPVLTTAAKGWVANKEIRNAELEALKMATLVQLYGVNQESGKLELSNDKGLFNPNANVFEQTMAMYKFFIGMGVEATDQVKSEGLMKAMNIGIDKALAKGKLTEKQAELMREEARHEVNRLLYKDDNRLSSFVQGVRNRLNNIKSWGNDDIGAIGLGDITMAFAKVPANVVRARLYATPEGCLLQLAQYTKGVMKAKRMHSETMARQIMESHAREFDSLRTELQKAYELDYKEVSKETKDAKIAEINAKLAALNRQCWNEARQQCSGGVYNKLVKLRDNYSSDLAFDDAVKRAGYSDAKEMSQFEAATYSRKIGKAATSAGMVALGAILRGLGALRDFDQEPDDELRKMYKQKGYSGLMFNWSAIGRPDHEWRDGDIVLDADFLEVLAMPLAIGATAREAAMNVEGKGKAKAFATEAATGGLSKTFEAVGDIPGMADAVNLYNAITSQFNTDNAAKGNRVFNAGVEYLANSLPSFFIPNAYTQFGAGLDNTVRDVYTTDNIWQQAKNIALNKTAYFRKKIPASVDMWGEERKYGEDKFWGVVNKSILPGDRLVYHQNKYEQEVIRLSKEGYKGAVPKLSVNGTFEVDGETYTLDADEKRAFRQNRNKEQAEFYKSFMDSDIYDKLTDEQKVAVLKELKTECERDAKQTMLNDRGLDVEVTRSKWETELKLPQQIQYLGVKQMAGAVWDKGENEVSDYAAMDKFIAGDYKALSKEQQKILNGSYSHLDDLADAAANGIKSEKWQAAYNIYQEYTEEDEDGKRIFKSDLKNSAEMWSKIQKATGFADGGKEMKWLEEHMKLTFTGSPNTQTYDELVYDYGLSRESASKIYNKTSTLQPAKGYSDVQDRQKWVALTDCGLSDKEQWDSFFAMVPSNNTKQIKNMQKLRGQVNPKTGKVYTFKEAIHKLELDVIYWKEVLPNGKTKKHKVE